jgi:hypothetical protein
MFDVDDFGNVEMTEVPLTHALSAFIGVTSAFIGVPKTCARITRYRPLNSGFAFARKACRPILKSSVP